MIPTTNTWFVFITVLLLPDSTNAFGVRLLNRAVSHRRKIPSKNDASLEPLAIPFPSDCSNPSQSFLSNKRYTDSNDDDINNGATWIKDKVMRNAIIPLKCLKNTSNLVFKKPHRLRKVQHMVARAACTILLALICSPLNSFAAAIGGVSTQVKPLTR